MNNSAASRTNCTVTHDKSLSVADFMGVDLLVPEFHEVNHLHLAEFTKPSLRTLARLWA
jgi:hypothetical protein